MFIESKGQTVKLYVNSVQKQSNRQIGKEFQMKCEVTFDEVLRWVNPHPIRKLHNRVFGA